MSVVVFRGPTITADAVRTVLAGLAVRCLPPAGQGDLYRAVEAGARTVVLIDGTFERGPAVWHKEILHALHHGVAVFGAASMGALRAVECGPFGMRGAGQIVSWYADGTLTDDDEVTVAHLDAEHDWRAVSDALVNIRATLTSAVADSVITARVGEDLVLLAKATFYPERSWPRLLADARHAGIEVAALAEWLPDHHIDLKTRDAQFLLQDVAAHLAAGADTIAPDSWRPEPSRIWLRARTAMAGSADTGALDATLDALRLDDAFYELHQAAFLRHLAVADAHRHGVHPDTAPAVDDLRTALGLATDDLLTTWLTANNLDEDGLSRLATDQARLAWAHRRHGDDIRTALADQLRIRGWYPVDPPTPVAAVDDVEAWDWYAQTRDLAGRGWPDPRRGPDELQALASHLGFAAPDDLLHAVRRAYAGGS